jgi:hypothetical protein
MFSERAYIEAHFQGGNRTESVSQTERAWFPSQARESEVESRGAVALLGRPTPSYYAVTPPESAPDNSCMLNNGGRHVTQRVR